MSFHSYIAAIILLCMPLCGCVSLRNADDELVERNPVRDFRASEVKRIEFYGLKGQEKHPYISGGIEKLFTVDRASDIKALLSGLQDIPDGYSFVSGSGLMTRLNLLDQYDKVLASVDVIWDARSIVIIGMEGYYFSGDSQVVPRLCFELIAREKNSFLQDILQRKRPGPPEHFLRERFPFDSLEGSDTIPEGNQ